MKRFKSLVFFAVFVAIAAMALPAQAKNNQVVRFVPASDGGRFITQHQSFTLPQWSFNAGAYFDYAFEPLEYADPTGTRRRGIVDDLVMANVQAAIGFTDWWTMGFDFPIALYEIYYNENRAAAAVQKQTLFGKMGDLRVEMKFRLLDIERYHVGLALVPYMNFPTGRSNYWLGTGMWSPGGKLVFDADIKNRVFLTLNAGYRYYQNFRYDFNNPNAFLDNAITLGGGINVRINDSWAVIGEVYSESIIKSFFKNQLQNPAEFVVAGRFTPQSMAKGLGVTLGGGRGITTGVGSPDFRILLGVNYRRIHEPPPPPPMEVDAIVEEKIIITQKIHFEFARAVIRPISYPILDDVAYLLQRNPQILRVNVEGHTDWIGPDSFNQILSERRAKAVREYLVKKGIEPDRLTAVGYGESRPIADNNTVKGRARNRRVEFTVTQVTY